LSVSSSGVPAQAGAATSASADAPPDAPADLREQGMLFRSLLEAPQTARQWAEFSTYRNLEDRSHNQGGDTGGLLQVQTPLDARQAFQPAAAAAAGAPDPAIAELIERHIRRERRNRRIRRGIRRTYQSSILFRSLSVADNLFLAASGVTRGRFAIRRPHPSHPNMVRARELAATAKG